MKQEVIKLARQALVGRMPMLVLRGGDEHARAEGDIDILVPSRQGVTACMLLAASAREAGWYLASFRDIGYLAQVVLIRPGQEQGDVAVKVDFFAGFEWYGVGSDVISRRFFKFVEASDGSADEEARLSAGVNFFQKCLIAGQLSERDWSRVVSGVAAPELLLEFAQALALPITARDVEKKGVSGWRQWRLRAASAGINGAIGFSLWFPRVAFAHLRFKLGVGTGAGNIIGLSGLDGSGKSTQVERLFSAYRQAGGEQPRLEHLLPEWIPMPHQLLRRKKTEKNYTRPYSEAPVRSKWSGYLRLAYYLAAFMAAKLWVSVATLRGQALVLDRCFPDFVVDLTRSRIPDFQLPVWLIKFYSPKGLLLFLDASPDTVVCRKGELQRDKATDLRQRYLKIFRKVEGEVIDAEVTPDEVFTQLLGKIDNFFRQRLATLVSK